MPSRCSQSAAIDLSEASPSLTGKSNGTRPLLAEHVRKRQLIAIPSRVLRDALTAASTGASGADLSALSYGHATAECGQRAESGRKDRCRPLDHSPRFGALFDS